jgi:serine/threonine protein phosphatase PrpC
MSAHFACHGVSQPGGRSNNEDFMLWDERDGVLCAVVADGLGGHAGGAEAAKIACEAAIASFLANPAVTPEAVQDHIRAADNRIREEQRIRPALASMRSTLVMLVASATQAIWGHVGDSRLYQLSSGRIVSQTKDHSMPQHLVDLGEIDPAVIRHHEDRPRLLRALGEEEAVRFAILTEPAILKSGDAFLLCSDGFWENVLEIEMELDFAKSHSPLEWFSFMEGRLRERADAGHDNYTAVAIQEAVRS